MTALDPGALVRLRDGGGWVTAYARLPFGVLVSRTVAGSVRPSDVTVTAADLFVALELPRAPGDEVPLPARRDVEWRAALPPLSGWQRLDEVPGDVVRSLVQAGAKTLRAVPASAAASAGETLLDHEALTVSAASRTVAVPLRVLTALAKMGFLGAGPGGRSGGSGAGGRAGESGVGGPAAGSGAGGQASESGAGGRTGGSGADVVVVSAAGRWVRLAAAYGSAFQHQQAGLGLSPR